MEKEKRKIEKRRGSKRGRGSKEPQEAAFGIYGREDGIVYIKQVEDIAQDTLQDIIKEKVEIETSIYSDTWKAYSCLDEEFDDYEMVDRGNAEYKKGDATINGIEGF